MLTVSAMSSRQVRAVALAYKGADADLRKIINSDMRARMGGEWKSLVEEGAARLPKHERSLLTGVRLAGGNPPRVMAAQSSRALGRRKSLRPSTDYPLAEFGVGDRERVSTYTRRTRGGTHTVNRRASRAWPTFRKTGRVVYPAFARFAPRVVAYWVQSIVRTFHDAAEGRS